LYRLIFFLFLIIYCVPLKERYRDYGFRPFYISNLESKKIHHESWIKPNSHNNNWALADGLITYRISFYITINQYIQWNYPFFVKVNTNTRHIFNTDKKILMHNNFSFQLTIPTKLKQETILAVGYFGTDGEEVLTDFINFNL